MEDRIEDLYYSYLKPKLDLVFDFDCDETDSLTIGPDRFEEEDTTPQDEYKTESEDYGPHNDWVKFNIYKNGELLETDFNCPFKIIKGGFYSSGRVIKKDGKQIVVLPTIHDKIVQSIDGVFVAFSEAHYKYVNGQKIDYPDQYKVFTENGYLLDKTILSYAKTIGNGYTIIRIKQTGKYNVIDKTGKPIFKKWTNDLKNISYNTCFITLEDETFPLKREFLDYSVKKKIVGIRHTIDNGYSKFTVDFVPLRIYDMRFSLGYVNDKLYIYDRALDRYKEIGFTKDFEFSEKDQFIIDKNNNKAFMIYGDQILDVSRYYEEHLKNGTPFKINQGVRILPFDVFSLKNHEEISQIIKEEANKNIQIRIDIEKKKQEEAFEKERKRKENEENELIELEKKAIRQLQESIETLERIAEKRPLTKKVRVENLFIEYPDHLEFRPELIPILRILDLTLDGYQQIKMDNIDFSGTNLSFNPQSVYNRSLRNSNFEGIHISPWWNFTGIDIRGCRFSEDKDEATLDIFNSTFAGAIYDETTTYNGIPLTMIIPQRNDVEEIIEEKGAPKF